MACVRPYPWRCSGVPHIVLCWAVFDRVRTAAECSSQRHGREMTGDMEEGRGYNFSDMAAEGRDRAATWQRCGCEGRSHGSDVAAGGRGHGSEGR